MYVGVSECVFMYIHVCVVFSDQKVSDHLEPELPMVLHRLIWVLGSKVQSSAKSV